MFFCFIIPIMPNKVIKESQFDAPWWCSNKHSQTLYPTLFRKRLSIKLCLEQFELEDGDFIDLAWTEEKKSEPIIILLHGLEGSIDSPYAKGILKTIHDNGWQGVLMHFRGCGNQHNRLPRGYHSGDTADLHALIETLRTRFPKRKLAAIGISLGGNVLLKYLGEQNKECLLTTAMAVSAPFDLKDSSLHLNKGFAKIYQRHLVSALRKKMLDKFKDKTPPISLNKIEEWKQIYEFDDNVTALLHGFKNAEDYYSKSSCKQFLKHINIPTLILHSKDDPFMPQKVIPIEEELSSSITLELTEHGGHVGFIYGKPFREKYWIEKRLVDFFKAKLS